MEQSVKRYPDDKSGGLFNYLRAKYKLDSDKALSKKTGLMPYVVSQVRNAKRSLSKQNKHDISVNTGLSIKKIDEMIAEGAAK